MRTKTKVQTRTRGRGRKPEGRNARDVGHNGRCSSYGRACTNAKAGRTREIDFEQIIGYLVQGRTAETVSPLRRGREGGRSRCCGTRGGGRTRMRMKRRGGGGEGLREEEEGGGEGRSVVA